jgi:hypothetical protein
MTYARRRAHIGPKEEREIKYYSLSPRCRDMTRPDLADKMIRDITWPGKAPEREVLEKKITDYRNKSVWPEDEPWSLGESVKPQYGIAAEATGVLLELWKYSLEIGYPLTLRHAKWIARLHEMIVTANDEVERWQQIQVLFFTASHYSDWERVSQLSNEERFDTRGEDADLTTPTDEVQILQIAGILPPPSVLGIPKAEEEFERRMGIKTSMRVNFYEMVRTGDFNVIMIVHYLHRPRSLDELPDPRENKESLKFYRAWIDIENKVGNLSIEQQRAYAILVTCFSKGPKWNDLSPKDFLEVIGGFAELASQQSRLGLILWPVLLDEGHAFAPYFKKVELTPPIDMDMDVETIFNLYGSRWRKDDLGTLAPYVGTEYSEMKRERQHKPKRRK